MPNLVDPLERARDPTLMDPLERASHPTLVDPLERASHPTLVDPLERSSHNRWTVIYHRQNPLDHMSSCNYGSLEDRRRHSLRNVSVLETRLRHRW
jgi:hypothetical protein